MPLLVLCHAAPTLARYSVFEVSLFLIGHNDRIYLGILFFAA